MGPNAALRRDAARGYGILGSPILFGAVLTWGFYELLPFLPFHRGLAEQYFCSHPLAYATTFLFFVATAILGAKCLRLLREQQAFRTIQLSALRDGTEGDRGEQLCHQVVQAGPRAMSSILGTRIRETGAFIHGRQSAAGLEDHLKYLAELTADRLHQSFAIVRTITWAIPILGFLGTVIGITIAIANVTPEQLDTSLGEVTGGLAVAFDTTALALALSIVLVFMAFVVERFEQMVCQRVEEFGIRTLLPLFPAVETGLLGIESVQQQASQRILEATEAMVTKQMSAWDGQLNQLREQWTSLFEQQNRDWTESLSRNVSNGLIRHEELLSDLRDGFQHRMEACMRQMSEHAESANQNHSALQAELITQVTELWERLQRDSEAIAQAQAEQCRDLIVCLNEQGKQWRAGLEQSGENSRHLTTELNRQAELLRGIIDQEENLARLQQQLAMNLDAVRAAETFESTLHSLNAAVHLLTGRVQSKAA